MTGNELLRWLEELMANYSPGRESGEALRRFVIRECQDIVRDHREAFIEALGQWLSRRQEPHTMLAVKLAAVYRLHELREPISDLLEAVERGEAFMPHYARSLRDTLSQLPLAE